jgi:hypothetical protein
VTTLPKTFVGKTSAELHLAGLQWLELAASKALDEDTMWDSQTPPHDDASTEAFEINTLGDKLLQQRNIAEAALAAQIGHSLIMAGLADNEADAHPERYYSGDSPNPIR